jgi:hypothetical protein
MSQAAKSSSWWSFRRPGAVQPNALALSVLQLSVAALLASACGASQSAAESPAESGAAAPVPHAATSGPAPAEAPQCVDDKDQRIKCLSDADCCPRFVCGKDPELSQSVTYCIFGG